MPFRLFRGVKSPPIEIKPSLNATSRAVYADSWGKKIGISTLQAGVGVGLSALVATYGAGIGVNKLREGLGLSQPTNAQKLEDETKAMKRNFDEQMREFDVANSLARDPNYYAFRNPFTPWNQLLTGWDSVKDNSGKTNAMPLTNAAVILGVLALAGIALVMFKRGKK